MPIKTFRGLIADGATDTIVLHTNDGSTGYRIVKFQVIQEQPGAQDTESTVTINKVPLPNLPEFDSSKVLEIMQNDKKVQIGSLLFILLEDIGHAVMQHNINEQSIINVLEDL